MWNTSWLGSMGRRGISAEVKGAMFNGGNLVWPETMKNNANQLAKPDENDILSKLNRDVAWDDDYKPFGDGHSCEKMVSNHRPMVGRKEMRYALIGCGRISTNHIKAAINNKLEIVAVCDVVPEHMESVLQKNLIEKDPGIRRYADYRTMLEEQKPELVSIATESGKHAEIALYCIEHGCNVIIEKPISMSLADADRIIESSERKHVKVSACHQNRFNVAVQKTRKALESGRFGKLSHGSINVRWNRDSSYYDQAPWRGTWKEDGGCLMNQCIHGIDLLRWMLGDDVETVYGVTRQQFHHYLEAEDVGMAVLKFKNGAIGTIEGTTNVYPKNLEETLYLFGQNGTVKIGGTSTNNIDVWNFSDETDADQVNKGLEEATSNVYGNGHTSLFADMIDAIENDRAPYVDAYAGRRALEIVLAIYKSEKTGLPVNLPLKDFASTDMKGEFDDVRR